MTYETEKNIASLRKELNRLVDKIEEMEIQQQKVELLGRQNLRILTKLAKKTLPLSSEDRAILDGTIKELEE